MFGALKALWAESGVESAVDGVIREFGRGNAVEVQRWYFQIKKKAYQKSLREGISAEDAENCLLGKIDKEKIEDYLSIATRLKRPGGVLSDVDAWLENNRPL